MFKLFLASFFVGLVAWLPGTAGNPGDPVLRILEARVPPAPPVAKASVISKVSTYVAKVYRIAPQQATEIVGHAFATAEASSLSPFLVLGIIAQESSFNPKAQSNVGATGLMQVFPRWHPEKVAAVGGVDKLTLKRANIQVGVAILKEYLDRGRGLSWALRKYSGGANDYEAKVLAHAYRFRMVAKL